MLATPSVGEGPPLPFIPVFLSNLLKCLGTDTRMLCYFTLWSLLPLDCNLLIPLLSLSSLQTFLLHNLLNLGVTCFVLILYIYWVITYFTFCNKGCHGPNLAWVVDRTNRNTLCPDVIMKCTLRMGSEYGLLAMLTVCTERKIRQLLLTVRNSAAILDRKVLLSSFHSNCHAHFRISSTNFDI